MLQMVEARNGHREYVLVATVDAKDPMEQENRLPDGRIDGNQWRKNANAVQRKATALKKRGVDLKKLYCVTEQGRVHFTSYIEGQRNSYKYS